MKNISAHELSVRCDMHVSHISRLENAEPLNAHLTTLVILSRALDVKVDDLFYVKEVA